MAADRSVRRVLMTTDTVGGVWHHSIDLAKWLGRRGVQVALATMGAPLSVSQRAQARSLQGVTLYKSSYRLEWMASPWDDVDAAGTWLQTLARHVRPDVVHLNQFAFGALDFGVPTLLVAHSCVLSWWQAVHGVPAPPAWAAYRDRVAAGLAGATQVAAPTAAMLAELRVHYGLRGPGVVLANGRDARSYIPRRKTQTILAAGRLWDPAKNLAALEAVAPQLDWPIHVAGSSAAPDGVMRAPCHVTWLGELAPSKLARRYSRAAIYALPARYEPFGQSILEAGLAGCALVVGDVPSLREIWNDAAIFVPPNDHVALSEALRRLIGDAAYRERCARAARHRALQFSPRRVVDAYAAAYQSLLNREIQCTS